MKNSLLFGSILAVVLLTLVSFSNVVGYQSVDSNDKVDSPLFNMKINKAVNKSTNTISNDYLGKNKLLNILLPKRIPYYERIDKIIDFIKDINDVEFEKLLQYIIPKTNNIENIDKNELINVIYQIKEKPDIFKNNFIMINDKEPEFVSIQPILFCILLWSFVIPLAIIVQLFFIIPLRLFCLIIPAFPTFY